MRQQLHKHNAWSRKERVSRMLRIKVNNNMELSGNEKHFLSDKMDFINPNTTSKMRNNSHGYGKEIMNSYEPKSNSVDNKKYYLPRGGPFNDNSQKTAAINRVNMFFPNIVDNEKNQRIFQFENNNRLDNDSIERDQVIDNYYNTEDEFYCSNSERKGSDNSIRYDNVNASHGGECYSGMMNTFEEDFDGGFGVANSGLTVIGKNHMKGCHQKRLDHSRMNRANPGNMLNTVNLRNAGNKNNKKRQCE